MLFAEVAELVDAHDSKSCTARCEGSIPSFGTIMISIDLDYLRRMKERTDPAGLFREPKFLGAQELFFSTVDAMWGEVDFDIADMREVHAVAALGPKVKGLRVLDVGCGSTEPYVLGNAFRDRYPPFFAEMLATLGAEVTGIDIRPNPKAKYDHRVLDLTKRDWATSLERPYDIVACFNIFNAPKSPFEYDATLCDNIMNEMIALLDDDGVLIVTLRDELFDDGSEERAREYVREKKLDVLHCDGNCIWLRKTA